MKIYSESDPRPGEIINIMGFSGNPSDHPEIDFTSLDAVLRLLQNQAAFFAELKRTEAIYLYLLQAKSWKDNSEQRSANGLPLNPPPIPPHGYVPPIEVIPTKPPVPPISFDGPNQFGQYVAYNDTYPVGTKKMFNTVELIKVSRQTPFGTAYWWEKT